MIVKPEPIEPTIPGHQGDTNLDRSSHLRRRRKAVEVLVRTKRQTYGHNPPLFENASTYIEKNRLVGVVKKEEEVLRPLFFLPHEKVEIKKEEMLSEDVVNRRLALVESFTVDLDPNIRDVTTTREFTSKRWGGNPQSTFPTIRPEMIARHGLDDFMFLNLLFNPHAPLWPGAPGLFFACSVHPEASEWGVRNERVLVRLKANRWLYVGQYQCTPTLSLTPEEWKSQDFKAKQTWASKVSTHSWGVEIRAKITLGKRLGRDPTFKELEDAVKSDTKFHATPEEIHRAFDEGRAVIQSWCMKCVGYDEDFQREIAAGNARN